MQPNVIRLGEHRDLRGALSFAEAPGGLPFNPARFFIVWDVPVGDVRGCHAHRKCDQLLVCTFGEVEVILDDGKRRESFVLNSPSEALRIPPGVWGEQRYVVQGTRLMVLASHNYDPEDYIADYDAFLSFKRDGK